MFKTHHLGNLMMELEKDRKYLTAGRFTRPPKQESIVAEAKLRPAPRNSKNVFGKFQKTFSYFQDQKMQVLCLEHMLRVGANGKAFRKH